MTNFVTIGDANINVDTFAAYEKEAMKDLRAEHEAKELAKEHALNFKETVEAVNMTTKLAKPEVSAYFKARFVESLPQEEDKVVGTKVAIDRGTMYSVLNSALDE